MCWGSLNLGPWKITFRRLSWWMIFRSPVITCPDGLYWKGEWEQSEVREVLVYVNILQCFFVIENVTANVVSVAIGDNGNRLIFEIWWNFFYDLFSIKNVADVNSIDSFVSKRNLEELYVVIMKRFRSNWFEKTKGRHVTYNTRQSVLRRKRIYASFVKSKIPKIFEVSYR
jgi:hypothetical protein